MKAVEISYVINCTNIEFNIVTIEEIILVTLCIAGKNNIAVSVLEYARASFKNIRVVFTPNKTDNGLDGWQRSALKYCINNDIDIVRLEDLYNIENLVFLSTEYDRLIKIEKFKTDRLSNIHFRAFAFKSYQFLKFNGYELIGSKITSHESQDKPGSVLSSDDKIIMIATIDYNIVMFIKH